MYKYVWQLLCPPVLPSQERAPTLLKKYDEEIEGIKKESFALGECLGIQYMSAYIHVYMYTVEPL